MSAHTCHATLCKTRCPPTYLMCPRHWRMVPTRLQRLVWATYREGQCRDKRPSREWHQAADAAIAAVALAEGCPWRKLKVVQARALIALMPSAFGVEERAVRKALDGLERENQGGT